MPLDASPGSNPSRALPVHPGLQVRSITTRAGRDAAVFHASGGTALGVRGVVGSLALDYVLVSCFFMPSRPARVLPEVSGCRAALLRMALGGDVWAGRGG